MVHKAVFIIIAVFGSYYLTRMRSFTGPRSNVPIEYYQPDDHKSELLSALEEVVNHTLSYLPNSRSGLIIVVDLESGSKTRDFTKEILEKTYQWNPRIAM